ncbi:hypothetical protein AB0A77_02105 [Streptomyces varsoviensis]|uniref:hypothetical protein n=1 Tax=Streptomyces varsoviensis TaxID=67373 RepID=UPI00340E1B0E
MAIPGNFLSVNAEGFETDTSDWTPISNVVLGRGSPGLDGKSCMLMRSVSPGDMQVGLVNRVWVTPGTLMLAFAGIFVPIANGHYSVEIRWFTSDGTPLGTAQGSIGTAETPSWRQVGVSAVVPPAAATANLVIRTSATGVQDWFADRVYIGLMPPVQKGNLLDFLSESIVLDSSRWDPSINCTLDLSLASFEWFQSLRITAQEPGEVEVQSRQTPRVTPGQEYVGFFQVMPGATRSDLRMEIWWYAPEGNKIGQSTSTWSPPTGAWSRCAVIGRAPAGAATARFYLRPTATTAGQQWLVDQLCLMPTSAVEVEGNLLDYNTADFEQDVSGWRATGGTISRSAEYVANGAYALKAVADGTKDLEVVLATPIPVEPGLSYQFVPAVRRPASVTRGYRTRLDWISASGEVVRTRWQTWGGDSGVYQWANSADVAPEGAATLRVALTVPGAAAGEAWYLDKVVISLGGLTIRTTPSRTRAGASLVVRGLTAGGPSWRWSLYRVIPGAKVQPVRGWTGDLINQAITSDVAVITDYEAPLGVPVQWRVLTSDPNGHGLFEYTTDSLSLPAESLDVWLKDPGLPARSMRATVGTPLPSWQRQARQGVHPVRYRSRPIVISDVRSSRTGNLVLVTHTEDERDALWWVLDSGNPLLIQWPPGWGESDVYVSVGDVTETHITELAEHIDRTWTLALTEVDRPVGGIVGSADRTWQTVRSTGASWSSALAGARSWLDVYTGVVGS